MIDFETNVQPGIRRRLQLASPRYNTLMSLLAVGVVILLSRSAYLQLAHGSDFRSRAEYNRVTPELLPAPRGIFYDRQGVQLTENITSTDLILDPVLLPRVEDEGYLVEYLPQIITGLTPETIRDSLGRSRRLRRPVLLAKALEHETVLKVEEAGAKVTGVRLVSSLVRKYPFGEVGAHVIGYSSAVTSEELDANQTLVPTDTTGKAGLEEEYDKALRGKHGAAYTEVNAAGRPLLNIGKQLPVSGEDIHLTLDIELQKYIHSLFADRAKELPKNKDTVAGAAVVMDPLSGAILALVSFPTYDPNNFSQPWLAKEAAEVFSEPGQPLFNRAVDGQYPSGSVIKPFLAAAGLQEGIITADTTIVSTGGITIGPWHFFDWKAGGHGVTDVKKAIADSVNTFFYLLAGGDETHTGLGVKKAGEYLKTFGWGLPTGIDLPSEALGFIPTPEWKESTFHEQWYIGDTYHLGIGQGNILVTPLQIAAGTSVFANRHTLFTPHFRNIGQGKGKSVPIDGRYIEIVRQGMRQAVTDGSARSLSTLPIALAGKTGTAQIGGTDTTHAWFTSFGPYDDPKLVVTILLEKGGAGDADAVPMAALIWRWWLEHSLQ